MKSSDHGPLNPQDVRIWLHRQIEQSNDKTGLGLFAVELKPAAGCIGYCGLAVFQDIDASSKIQIGYRLLRDVWGNGYATEAASAVRDYAFQQLALDRLFALIEPVNSRSIRVAENIGMTFVREIMLAGYDHPDHLYSLRNPSQQQSK